MHFGICMIVKDNAWLILKFTSFFQFLITLPLFLIKQGCTKEECKV